VGGQEFFLLKRKGGPTFSWEKYQNAPALPPQEKTYLPLASRGLSYFWAAGKGENGAGGAGEGG